MKTICTRGAILCALMAALISASALGRAQALEIVAHRGASHLAPENTLAAVRLAWKLSADAVEIDVRLSKEGTPVLCHDGVIKRIPGKKVKVHEKTVAELQKLDVGKWKGDKWAGEKIPTLAQVLAELPAGRKLFVEIKGGPKLIPAIARTLKASGKKSAQIVIIGFSFDTMRAAKKALPGYEVSWLARMSLDKKTGKWKPALAELLDKCKKAGLNGLSLNSSAAIDAPLVRSVHKAGLKLNVWTVNSPNIARRLKKLGVDYLTTDRPGWMRDKLGLKPPATRSSPPGKKPAKK